MSVELAIEDGIAVVTVDNPPVNALGHAVRKGLLDAFLRTEADSSVKAVVLICAGRTFFAGADIREFGLPAAEPTLPDLLDRIEAATRPWVAAIHGTALGGGLETALVCRHRVASPSARLGFPEVLLGLIPGAGGTVRLPRLVAAEIALGLVSSGKPVTAARALEIGLIDDIAHEDLRATAIAAARRAASAPLAPATIDRAPCPPGSPDAVEAEARRVSARARGQRAPIAAVAAIRNALTMPPREALAAERSAFLGLRDGAQSRALRHIFFAEKASGQIDEGGAQMPRPLSRVGVVGGGTMGAGIAAACLLAQIPVTLVEQTADAARAAGERVLAVLDASRARGLLSPEDHADRIARFAARTDYAALADADLVIEAVFEDMAVKKAVFAALDEATGPDTILATNTSYLDVGEIARATRHPSRVLGLHFFAPAHVMKLLEIVVPDGLGEAALATGVALARKLGKIAVRAGVCDGFIANRIMSAYRREAEYMLEDGALPWEIDAAMTEFGFPMGLFQMQDLSGLDISWAMRKRREATRDPAERYVRIGDLLCEAGHFGRKTGRGYYHYDATGTAHPSAETEALIRAESAARGIARRPITAAAILDRLLLAMQAEGRRILAEGIARNADDIDVVMVNAFGFPRWRGGPMFMASSGERPGDAA